MFPKENRDRQEMLSGHIYDLSKDVLDHEEQLKIIQKLQMIYQDGFRHSYSDFFPVILEIFKEDNEYNDEYLMTNLESLREKLEVDYSEGNHQFKDVYAQCTKLCDHLNLQISQMKYFFRAESKANDAYAQIRQADDDLKAGMDKLEKAEADMNKAQEKLKKANVRAETLQTELIAVLSIFAAIVITLSGGFTFLGSVMTSIQAAKYYEMVILTAILCGMFMFNTIFLMMYLVAKITKRNIYADCLKKKGSCAKCTKKCNGFGRIRKRLPYVFYFNVLSLLGVVINCVVWFFDIKGFLP